ncbi:hypothetical protein QQX98_005056 [Neonectria punicea]|uniref:2EXR domain-containing protein n=1 Tax=Neonectria punicea TaxID=979145 RepID=A0ABR1H6L6_9HYPO
MATSTFHHFPELPRELRDLIWAHAVRPARPGAHFFTLFDAKNKAEARRLHEHAVLRDDPKWCNLAAPRCNELEPRTPSWTASNPSAYLIDGGLWTACKESREVMEKHFDTVAWRQKCCAYLDVWFTKDRPNAPATGAFTSNGNTQYFTMYPKTDLFCLQPHDVDTINWDDLTVYVPIFHWRYGFQVKHIALEFDPKSVYLEPGESLASQPISFKYDNYGTAACIARAAEDLWQVEHLWIIDYRLKRRPGTPDEDGSHEFYGNSGRYVEVPPWKRCGWYVSSLDESLWQMDGLTHPHEFIEELEEGLEGTSDYPYIGVLAYEEFT